MKRSPFATKALLASFLVSVQLASFMVTVAVSESRSNVTLATPGRGESASRTLAGQLPHVAPGTPIRYTRAFASSAAWATGAICMATTAPITSKSAANGLSILVMRFMGIGSLLMFVVLTTLVSHRGTKLIISHHPGLAIWNLCVRNNVNDDMLGSEDCIGESY